MTANPWAADDALIEAALLAGPTGKGPDQWPRCRWCAHEEHGHRCYSTTCPCDGTYVTRTDEWRPNLVPGPLSVPYLMHAYGVDGYTAHVLAGKQYGRRCALPTTATYFLRTRLLKAIKGEAA